MNTKLILIAAAGVVSLAGGFVAGWLTQPKAALGSADPAAQAAGPLPAAPRVPPALLAPTPAAAGQGAATRALTEQQLKELIYEIRERIQEYDRKLQELEKDKERLHSAQHTLKQDIETLNNLRVDLAASVAGLKAEHEALRKTRIEIEQGEKASLIAIAAAYDRMDEVRAAEILRTMAQGQTAGGVARTANADDAVKILRFMQERTKAKVLAEMAATEPALAAALSQRLKQVVEKK